MPKFRRPGWGPDAILAMKRKTIPELLDTDSGTTLEISSSFRDLRHINRWFGGNATTVSLLTTR